MKGFTKKLMAVFLAAALTFSALAVCATANEEEVYEDWYLDELYNQGLYDQIPDYYWEENEPVYGDYEKTYIKDYTEDFWYDSVTIDNIIYEVCYEGDMTTASVIGYEYDEDGYPLVDAVVVIPETVECNGVDFTVESIGFFAFESCHTLREITLPSTIVNIFDGAFYDTSNLEKIIVPSSIEFECFGYDVFEYSTVLGYLAENSDDGEIILGQNVLLAYLGEASTYTLPEEIDYIADRAFFLSGVKEVILNDNITEIAPYTFSSCRNLVEITVPDSVYSIGEGAFSNCENLENVNLGDSLELISYRAFEGTKIKDIYLGADVYDVVGAFAGCETLETITISEENGNYSFENEALYYSFINEDDYGNEYRVSNLEYFIITSDATTFSVPADVCMISSYAFYNCTQLEKVIINSELSINDSAFEYCTFDEFDFSKVTDIGYNAFRGCENLRAADLSNIIFICDSAFEHCVSLEEVTFSEDLYCIGSRAFADTALKTAEIGGNCCDVYESAFADCADLTRVNFNDGVCYLGNNLFTGCPSLETVYVSKTVEYIDYYAFNDCENVTFEIIKHSDSANIIVEYANDDENDVTNYVFVGKLSVFERLYDFFADIFERIYEFFFRW